MTILFWIIWTGEFILAGWWLQDELKLTRLQPNPFVFISILYLLAALGIRYGLKFPKISMSMVAIPAVPLIGLGLIILLSVCSGARWN